MFEAVVLLCAVAGQAPCRAALLPGYEAAEEAGCAAQLVVQPPALETIFPDSHPSEPECRPVAEALALEEVAPGIWVHVGEVAEPDADNRGDVSNLAIVIGEEAVAVIDSGAARWIGEGVWRAIRARTALPVRYVILTHMHPDHVYGASVFRGAEVVGHAKLARALADRDANYRESLGRLIGPAFLGSRAPEVTLPVAEERDVALGGRVLRVMPQATAHTETDLIVADPQTGTLFAGDLLFHRHAPALDGSLRGWLGVMEDLVEQRFERVVPGHGDASLPWPEGAEGLRRYLATLARDTRAAIAAGERLGEAVGHIAGSERPHWALFDAYNPRNATVAFTELEWE